MKTSITTLILAVAAVLTLNGQVEEVLTKGSFRYQVRNPSGKLNIDFKETLDGAHLNVIDKYYNISGSVTQLFHYIQGIRTLNRWYWTETNNYSVTWSNGVVTTNINPLGSRGFQGSGHVGSTVWKSWDNTRTFIFSSATWRISWIGGSYDFCDGMTKYARSIFNYDQYPAPTPAIRRIMGECTVSSQTPEIGQRDEREAIVTLPVPLGTYWHYFSRSECYYCYDQEPCWNLCWPPFWQTNTLVAARSVEFKNIESNNRAEIWRTQNFKDWELQGYNIVDRGVVRWIDARAPTSHAFYRIETDPDEVLMNEDEWNVYSEELSEVNR